MKNVVTRCLMLVLALQAVGSMVVSTVGANQNADNTFRALSIGEGARPAGMGEAFTALADDVNSVYWNPAGLSSVDAHEITTSYLQYLVDVNIGYAAYALPAFNGGLGIGVTYVDYGAIKELTYEDPSGNLGDYRPYDLVLNAAYGRQINEWLSAGVGMKGIYEEIKGYTAHAVAADAGLLSKTPVKDLTVGLALQNLGVQTKAFVDETHSLPVTCKLGVAYRLLGEQLKLAADYYQSGSNTSGLNGGVEYLFRRMISLRCGYQTKGEDLKTGSNSDSITGFSAGLGIKYGCLNIDYAFVPYNELGQTQRISLSFRFGKKADTGALTGTPMQMRTVTENDAVPQAVEPAFPKVQTQKKIQTQTKTITQSRTQTQPVTKTPLKTEPSTKTKAKVKKQTAPDNNMIE